MGCFDYSHYRDKQTNDPDTDFHILISPDSSSVQMPTESRRICFTLRRNLYTFSAAAGRQALSPVVTQSLLLTTPLKDEDQNEKRHTQSAWTGLLHPSPALAYFTAIPWRLKIWSRYKSDGTSTTTPAPRARSRSFKVDSGAAAF